jgi:hypothetical protein
MSASPEYVALAFVGQRLREQGLALRLRQLRHAISTGEVDARRIGSRWFVTEAQAKRFAQPLGSDVS